MVGVEQVVPASHWPELCIVVLVINAGRKENPSTSGMKSSVETSALLQHRTAVVVPERMKAIEAAIAAKDFEAVAEISMKDSNQFHAICADTFPPIRYMNAYSMAVVALVHAWNKVPKGGPIILLRLHSNLGCFVPGCGPHRLWLHL